jgi:hypothetical protein
MPHHSHLWSNSSPNTCPFPSPIQFSLQQAHPHMKWLKLGSRLSFSLGGIGQSYSGGTGQAILRDFAFAHPVMVFRRRKTWNISSCIVHHCPPLAKDNITINYARAVPAISETILDLTKPTQPLLFQFLLDCSVIPRVISLVQEHGDDVLHHLFKISRTWCYSLHRDRLKISGRWTPWL